MPIRIEQPGLADLYGRAGTIIGQAQRAKEREERASRRIEMLQEFELRKESERLSHQLALDRLRLGAQMELEGRQRALAWDIEKKEIASRLDFQRKEQARQRELDRIDTAKETLKKHKESDWITDEEYRRQMLYLDMKEQGVDMPVGLIQPKGTKPVDVEKQAMTHLERVDDVTQILSSFGKNKDVNPGFGKTIVPLAVREEYTSGGKKKTRWVEATESEKQLYEQAKQMQQQLLGQPATTTAIPDFIKPEDQQKYRLLIQRGWTDEAIRAALGM